MSDEDLEIIPILDDVLVAGDLDKAVTGDIDTKDLESIESFDALFEDSKTDDDESNLDYATAEETVTDESIEEENHHEPSAEITYADNETSDDDSFESSSFNAYIDEQDNDEIAEPLFQEEGSPTESVESTTYTDSEFEATDNIEADNTETENSDMDDADQIAAADTHEETPYLESSLISPPVPLYDDNPSLIDQEFDGFDEEPDNTDETESIPAPEYETQANFLEPEQFDANQIVEKVIQEIMPELEIQIRSIVLASLEKQMKDSDNIIPSEPETESDNEQ